MLWQQSLASQPSNSSATVASHFVPNEIDDSPTNANFMIEELAGLEVDREATIISPTHILWGLGMSSIGFV
jgi:hypothetical protein